SDAELVDRLLRTHRGGSSIAVFNDEAHHCYTLRDTRVAAGPSDLEEKRDRRGAELWFGALRKLKGLGRLGQGFDLSATPMWLRRPSSLRAETFPWTVSDFSLIDAVESGLVKVPRVPVEDHKTNDDGELVYQSPRYRNVYQYNGGSDLEDALPPKVYEPLGELYAHYEETSHEYGRKGLVPVMIVVANTIKNATALHSYISGYKATDQTWAPGQFELFSNIAPSTGKPRRRLPTILVHSRLDDPNEAGRSPDKIGKVVYGQAELFAPDAKNATQRREAIRDVFMSVGRKGMPGEAIRCVISVGMLTEGWDARSVTHVFGYRAFGSQLLCEQVAGRALRKIAFTGTDELQPLEYANLFGVPFTWQGGISPGPPPPIVKPRDVRTVEGRAQYRISFPHVAGYSRLDLSAELPHSCEPLPPPHPDSGGLTQRVL
ncbi:MAG: hypothetical protein OXB95_07260, partial [Rhodobacteraceae bacterium]|nr:hypothetical protein [Paracoccaceae bacterium]